MKLARRHKAYSLSILALSITACADPPPESLIKIDATINNIYWSDGDSGRIDGVDFRLSNVDAPETGGVGAAIGGAKCELERERGFAAKEFIFELTQGAELKVTARHGVDRFDRQVVALSANGVDVASAGIEAGVLKVWPHDGQRQLAKKPEWCSDALGR